MEIQSSNDQMNTLFYNMDRIDEGNTNKSSGVLNSSIPRRIWQTWKTKDVPDKWELSPLTIKKHMREWTYTLTTDEDNRRIVKENFPDFLDTYDSFEYPIQRADAIRYMILYLYGGLYLDLDYEMQHSLEPHLVGGDLFFIESVNVGGYLTNSIMASRAGHPIWLDMLNEMKTNKGPFYAFGKHLKVITTTGPGMVDRVVKRGKYKYVLLDGNKVNPCNICDIGIKVNHEAVLRPLEGGSWASWDTAIYNSAYCNWGYLALWVLAILLIVLMGVFMARRSR